MSNKPEHVIGTMIGRLRMFASIMTKMENNEVARVAIETVLALRKLQDEIDYYGCNDYSVPRFRRAVSPDGDVDSANE